MATINLNKTKFTRLDRAEIRSEVTRFERLYQGRGGTLTHAQRANLTRAFQYAVELGIGLGNAAYALMAWGAYTESIKAMLESPEVMERLLCDYDGEHKSIDGYVRWIYRRYYNVDNPQALRFVDTKAFRAALEDWGWCFAPSLDDNTYHIFID